MLIDEGEEPVWTAAVRSSRRSSFELNGSSETVEAVTLDGRGAIVEAVALNDGSSPIVEASSWTRAAGRSGRSA